MAGRLLGQLDRSENSYIQKEVYNHKSLKVRRMGKLFEVYDGATLLQTFTEVESARDFIINFDIEHGFDYGFKSVADNEKFTSSQLRTRHGDNFIGNKTKYKIPNSSSNSVGDSVRGKLLQD